MNKIKIYVKSTPIMNEIDTKLKTGNNDIEIQLLNSKITKEDINYVKEAIIKGAKFPLVHTPLLKKEEININCFNNKHFVHYNPFVCIETAEDAINIAKLINCDEDLEISEQQELLMAAIIMLIKITNPEEASFTAIPHLNTKGDLDKLFMDSEKRDPGNTAFLLYKKATEINPKYIRGMVIGAFAKLSVFYLKEVQMLLSKDDIHIKSFIKNKEVIFINLCTDNFDYHSIGAMLCRQIIDISSKAGTERATRFIINEPLKWWAALMPINDDFHGEVDLFVRDPAHLPMQCKKADTFN